jgi:tRNA threonylcarbamoyladenosine biosynthesis protein TsaE
MKKYLTNNEEETKKLGEEFSKELKPGQTVLLFGNLGAGKTTFVQGLAKGLGVKDRIISPTFVLVRNHEALGDIKNLNHIDLYRLKTPEDIRSLGIEDFLADEKSITLIEWADRLLGFKPDSGFKITINSLEENKREISIENI